MKIIIILLFSFSAFAQGLYLPSAQMQSNIILDLREQMIRLDGEGLIARKDRSETFIETTDRLALEALTNNNIHDFFHSFQQVDGTYTNLHSRTSFNESVTRTIDLPWHKSQSVWLFTETSTSGSPVFYADWIPDPKVSALISEGDRLIKINGRPVEELVKGSFLYCKYTLKIQCQRQFESNLLSLKLEWKGNTDLIYTFLHKQKHVDVKINFSEEFKKKNNVDKKRCDYKANKRYPGFKLVHLGYFACLYEKIGEESIAILRISSFQYKRRRNETNPYESIWDEVADFEKTWLPRAGTYKNLIIDVLDNTGGNLPIGYYQLLFHGEFQEQYVRFKKTPEFENQNLRNAMIWNDPSHEMTYQRNREAGLWSELSYGEFTSQVPMFCADSNLPCDESLWQAKKHDFNGLVHVMLNERCISSCDGFTWAMKNSLNAKFYGFPQAADSAYSRLRIDVIEDPMNVKGYSMAMAPQRAETPANLIVSQVVAVSRTTDADGNVFNGNPISLDEFVGYRFGEYYPRKVLLKVLSHIKK